MIRPPHMARRRKRLFQLGRDNKGVAAIEFAMIAPTFVMILMAGFDIGFGIYAKGVLQGAVEDAARTASLENTSWEAIKSRVNNQVRKVIPSADPATDITFTMDPSFYGNYADVSLPEDFTDSNGDGNWDPNECFVDRNANSQFDTDVGIAGRGGAQDVVAISAELTFERVFPLWAFMGQPNTITLEAKTFLRNQPFSAQAARVGVRICP